MELNPQHPATQEMHDLWHKMVGILMCKMGVKEAAHPELPLYREWMETLHTGPCKPLNTWDWRADYAQFAGRVQ